MNSYTARIIKIRYFNKHRVLLEIEKPKNFSFLEGQFISIRINDNSYRSYSILSNNKDGVILLLIELIPNGLGSNYIKTLKIGSIISFAGPFGRMTLFSKKEKNKAINYVATGVGVVPFISMISVLTRSNKLSHVKLVLLYSEKFKNDFINLGDYFDTKKIVCKYFLTREDSVEISKGRVTKFLDQLDYSTNSLFYLCGTSLMVNEVSENLQKYYNVESKRILTETFYG